MSVFTAGHLKRYKDIAALFLKYGHSDLVDKMHRDVPGLIGFVGTIFGTHGVNIAQMTVGRQAPGGEAIGILNLDNPPSEEALAAVRNHPQISSLMVVKLPAPGELPAWLG